MNFYKLDYTVEKILEMAPTREQKILRELTGVDFEKSEAQTVLDKILDHKWYVGEKLQRDIGLRAAAIDFVENIYEPPVKNKGGRGGRSVDQNVLSPITFAA